MVIVLIMIVCVCDDMQEDWVEVVTFDDWQTLAGNLPLAVALFLSFDMSCIFSDLGVWLLSGSRAMLEQRQLALRECQHIQVIHICRSYTYIEHIEVIFTHTAYTGHTYTASHPFA